MKVREYEKKTMFIVFLLIVFLIEILFLLNLIINKVFTYESFQGIVVKDNVIALIISKNDLDLLYQNHYLYVNNKKKEFKVIQVVENVLTRDKQSYNEVLIKFSFTSKKKMNDIIEFSLQKKKIRIIEIFKIIWRGENYETSNK